MNYLKTIRITFIIFLIFLLTTGSIFAFEGKVFSVRGSQAVIIGPIVADQLTKSKFYIYKGKEEKAQLRVLRIYHTKIIAEVISGSVAKGDAVTDSKLKGEKKEEENKYINEIEPDLRVCIKQLKNKEITHKKYFQCYNEQLEKFQARFENPNREIDMVRISKLSSSLWRNAVLPGWGQFYDKNNTRGWMYSSLYLTALFSGMGAYYSEEEKINVNSRERNGNTGLMYFFIFSTTNRSTPGNPLFDFTVLSIFNQILIREHDEAIKKSNKNQSSIGTATLATSLIILSSSIIDSFLSRRLKSNNENDLSGINYQLEIMPHYAGFSVNMRF